MTDSIVGDVGYLLAQLTPDQACQDCIPDIELEQQGRGYLIHIYHDEGCPAYAALERNATPKDTP